MPARGGVPGPYDMHYQSVYRSVPDEVYGSGPSNPLSSQRVPPQGAPADDVSSEDGEEDEDDEDEEDDDDDDDDDEDNGVQVEVPAPARAVPTGYQPKAATSTSRVQASRRRKKRR